MRKLVLLVLLLPGCAAAKVRKEIAADLNTIVQSGDCPTICDAIKAYIDSKLAN